MARIRSIKIGFFQNEELAKLPPHDRILYAGLWVLADREGRLLNRPGRIRAEVFPHEAEIDTAAALARLADSGHIQRYEADEARCIQVTKFLKHQKPHPKEQPSELPPPPAATYKEAAPSPTRPQPRPEAAAESRGISPDLNPAEAESHGNQPGKETAENRVVFGLGDLGLGGGLGDGVPAAPAATDELPRDIAAIRAKEPWDRTHEENNRLLAFKGVVGVERAIRAPRTGIDATLVNHRGCFGAGVLPSCTRGVCVKSALVDEWRARLAANPQVADVDEHIRRFIADTMRVIPAATIIGEDTFVFWRRAWNHANGNAINGARRVEKSDVTRDGARAILGDQVVDDAALELAGRP